MLCCIGDLVEDVVVWPSADLAHGTDTTSRIFRRRGGSAATVAVYAVTAGIPARFIGQVGNDRLGSMLVDEMEAAGVEVRVARNGVTGSIVVLVDQSGERTMLPDRGAAMELAMLPAGSLDGVEWLHVPAYSLVVEPLGATSRRAIEQSRGVDARVSVDASSVGALTEYGVAEFTELMIAVAPDVFFCNADEAALLGVDATTPVAGAELTVIKDGPHPVTLVDRSGHKSKVSVPPVAVVSDTTGAGDSFAAAFIASTINGSQPVDAARAACRMAATVLSRPGAGS